jgi:osmoprotectant transport system ATP-binding protein
VAETDIDGLLLGPDDWVLVNRSDGKPLGWVNAQGVDLHRKGSSLYDSTYGGGSLFRPEHSLRQAMDAALSSPSGLGVAVDDDGQLIGGVRADDVLEALNSQRRDALPKLGSEG